MHLKAEINTDDYSHAIYKIKRLAKISAVVLGISVVSGSVCMITLLYGTEFAIRHHKDPAGLQVPVTAFFLCMAFIAIASFIQGVWEIEEKARREMERKFTELE